MLDFYQSIYILLNFNASQQYFLLWHISHLFMNT